MAVYEHIYKPYTGEMTAAWSRFLIIPRHLFKDIFQSKLFIGFFCSCFISPLVMGIIIYLHHNSGALAALHIDLSELVAINSSYFMTFFNIQQAFAFLLTVVIGPILISRDVSNNALPLYLCRPFSRSEYVIGKLSVLLILISLISWVPGLLLFLFQSYLEGAGWFGHNLRIAVAIFVASLAFMIMLALLAVSMSAWVKWRLAASAAIFGVYTIPSVFAASVDQIYHTAWGEGFSLSGIIGNITSSLFGLANSAQAAGVSGPPVWSQWMLLAMFCAVCLTLLNWKLRAYEVIT
jgi:ABC-2 type transport system permease protein